MTSTHTFPLWIGRTEFEDLLRSLFNAESLRQWIASEPDLCDIRDSLPGVNAPLQETVHQTTNILMNHGLLEDRLFENLSRRFPHRRSDIDSVWQTWRTRNISPSGTPLPPKFVNPEMQRLAEELAVAYRHRAALVLADVDLTEIDKEILRLRRLIREGPQIKAGDFLHHGRFQLGEQVGQGGYASVWLAYDHELRERVAVKILHGHKCGETTSCERFKRGARNTANLRHRNIIRIVRTAFEDLGYHAYVMEYTSGGDLLDLTTREKLPEERIVDIFTQICDALDHAHRAQIIHRDIKPSNILIDVDGVPRLTDFDIMKSVNTTGGTRTGANLGTVCYSDPLIWENPDAADERSDVYSLGMTLLACLLRKDIHYGILLDSKIYLRDLEASPGLKQLIARAIARTPEARPASAQEFCRQLREAHDDTNATDPAQGASAAELERFLEEYPTYLSSDRWSRAPYHAADGHKLITLVLADICQMTTGAIICGVSQDAGIGILGSNIAALGGPSRVPGRHGDGPLTSGKVIVAQGGKLASEHVFYVVQDDSDESRGERLPEHIRRLVVQTLRVADALQLRSIAYPLLMTGVVGLPRDLILRLTFETLYEVLGTTEHLEEVFIAIYPYSQAIGLRRVALSPPTLSLFHDAQLEFSIAPENQPLRAWPIPRTLTSNVQVSFSGTKIHGSGFLLTADERDELIRLDPQNAVCISPYITAADVCQESRPNNRYVINFGSMTYQEAEQWPYLLQLLRERVKPEREKIFNQRLRRYWWRFGASTSALYDNLRGYRHCIVSPQISPHLVFVPLSSDHVFANSLHVHVTDSTAFLGCVQSRVFAIWGQMLSSSLGDDSRWDIDAFNTFPFPYQNPRANHTELAGPGRRLETLRTIFIRTNQRTLIQTYNDLKNPASTNPELLSLREVHVDLDKAVLSAYGWTNIPIPPYTAPENSKEEAAFKSFEHAVLERLSALNLRVLQHNRGAFDRAVIQSPARNQQKTSGSKPLSS